MPKFNTPWGAADQHIVITRGLHCVSTPSHGGYMISVSLAKKVLPRKTYGAIFPFVGSIFGKYYCYEEDQAYQFLIYELLHTYYHAYAPNKDQTRIFNAINKYIADMPHDLQDQYSLNTLEKSIMRYLPIYFNVIKLSSILHNKGD